MLLAAGMTTEQQLLLTEAVSSTTGAATTGLRTRNVFSLHFFFLSSGSEHSF